MDPKLFAAVFSTVFVAELGDKTQLATLLYAAEAKNAGMTVFAGAASALVLASALGVLAGAGLAQWLSPRLLRGLAGFCFVAIGLWILLRGES